MFCPRCGNEETNAQASFCSQCGYDLRQTQQPGGPVPESSPRPPYVPNYLAQAILVTIFCCIPAGIVAIVFSAQVNGKLAAGDYDGAVRSSNTAKTWCWVAFGLGIAVTVLYVGGICALGLTSLVAP